MPARDFRRVRRTKYGRTYQAIRRALEPVVASGLAECVEPVCKMPSRAIKPGSAWDLAHDPTGTRILGPAHRTCNRSEAAVRGNTNRKPRTLKL